MSVKIIEMDGKYRIVTTLRNNLLHSENGLPAYIQYDENNNICLLKWYKNGVLHNDHDLPAVIKYYNGNIVEKCWYVEDKRSRPSRDLPDWIVYICGNVTYYWSSLRISDKHQPCGITYNENHTLVSKYFTKKSDIEYIFYYSDGVVYGIMYNIADRGIKEVTYYPNGNLRSKTICDSEKYTIKYDVDGWIKQIIYYKSSTVFFLPNDITNTVYYDKEGNIIKNETT